MQRRVVHCNTYLALWWVAFSLQAGFLAVVCWAISAKQVHNFRVRPPARSRCHTSGRCPAARCFPSPLLHDQRPYSLRRA